MRRFCGLLLAGFVSMGATAQEKIYRCGNEYTNMPPAASVAKCSLITQGNVTVVPAVKPPPPVSQAPVSAPRTAAQRSKDADARFILESELKKAQAHLAELRLGYNDGEPEKQGGESRNYQKYLDRVAEMKANIQRSEADVASLKREIARLNPAR